MMGFYHFVFVVSFLVCGIWGSTVRGSKDKPCAPKYFADAESVVCECNATYCDNLVRDVPCEGEYIAYTSSACGLRLAKSNGRLNTYSRTACAKYSKVLYLTPSVKYQKILGFGGAVSDSAAINWKSLSETVQDAFIQSYYGKEGIGFSMARVPMGGTDFSEYFYTYSADEYTEDPELVNFKLTKWDYDYKIPMLKAIMKATPTPLKVHSNIWTPPDWMRVTSDYNKCGFMKEKFYQTLADYYKKFIEEYTSNGIPIWAIATSNEPSFGYRPMPEIGNCLGWNQTDNMSQWISQNLGPTIRNMTQKITILGNEDMRLYIPYWIKQLTAEALKYIDGISVHWYLDNVAPPSLLDDVHDSYPEKFLFYSESSRGLGDTYIELGSWASAEAYVSSIIENINHHVVGWVDWCLCLNRQGGPSWVSNFLESAVYVFAEGDYFVKNPAFYAMAHVAKFAVRGSYRIKVVEDNNCENSVEQFAVLTPDNTIAVVLSNPSNSSATVGIVLGESVVNLDLVPKSITTVELPNDTSGCQLQTLKTLVPGTPLDVEYKKDSAEIVYNPC